VDFALQVARRLRIDANAPRLEADDSIDLRDRVPDENFLGGCLGVVFVFCRDVGGSGSGRSADCAAEDQARAPRMSLT